MHLDTQWGINIEKAGQLARQKCDKFLVSIKLRYKINPKLWEMTGEKVVLYLADFFIILFILNYHVLINHLRQTQFILLQ